MEFEYIKTINCVRVNGNGYCIGDYLFHGEIESIRHLPEQNLVVIGCDNSETGHFLVIMREDGEVVAKLESSLLQEIYMF